MKNVHVLIVECDSEVAIKLEKLLEELGYTVMGIAPSRECAIKVVQDNRPSIIIMGSVSDKNVDGIQVAKEISQIYHVPIIFLCEKNDISHFERSKMPAAYAFLSEPYKISDIYNAIEISLYRGKIDNDLILAVRRYQAIMNNASCGIFLYDDKATIIDINESALNLIRRTSEEVIGTDFRKYIVAEDQNYAEAMLVKLAAEKKIGPNKASALQSNGAVIELEYTSVYVEDESGNFSVCILTDLTERNRLRAQTMLSDKLATIGALSAGLIHEINNPLTWVLTNLIYLHDKLSELRFEDIEKKTEYLKILNESLQGADRIKELIRNLKGFARIHNDKLTPISIKKILEDTIVIAGPQLKSKAKVETNISDNIPMFLMPGSRIEQVFLNLIVNAVQSFESEDIDKNIIIISAHVEKNILTVSIADTGAGIPDKVLSRIFEPFYTTKPTGVGTGLGLSICADIIHTAGGELTVKSTVGVGTVFTISLPIQVIVDPAEVIDKDVDRTNTRSRILVVDDEPTLLLVIQRMLEKNHDITISNSRNALELLAKDPYQFDIMITDVNMPDVSGIDLYRYTTNRKMKLAEHTIFTTGGPTSPLYDEFIVKTSNPCLEKPFTLKQLNDAIAKVCSE